MLAVEIFFSMSRKEGDLMKMKPGEYSDKLYMALHTVTVDRSCIEISSWITFCLIMMERLRYVILGLVELLRKIKE